MCMVDTSRELSAQLKRALSAAAPASLGALGEAQIGWWTTFGDALLAAAPSLLLY